MCKGVHMNKLKFIPFLAIAALLSGCGTNASDSIKKVKFAKEGEEIESAPWFEEVMSGLNNLDYQDTKFINSKEGYHYSGSEMNFTLKRDNKVLTNEKTLNSLEYKVVSDFDNKIINMSMTQTQVDIAETKGSEKHNNKQVSEMTGQYQKTVYDQKDYYVSADPERKVAYLYMQIDNSLELADIHDYFTKGSLSYQMNIDEMYNFISSLGVLTDEELDDMGYKFYKNDNVYTLVFADEYENYENKIGDDENAVVYATSSGNFIEKIQVTLGGGNFKFQYSYEDFETYEYLEDYNNYYAGDKTETKRYGLEILEHKDTNEKLKALDTTGYQFIIY